MLPTTSKRLVEEYCGRFISDQEYKPALEYALMKLDFQSKIFNKDFDTDYLTIVVAEEVNQCRLDKMYAERIAILKSAQAEQCEQSIKSGAQIGNFEHRHEGNSMNASQCPYYSTAVTTMQ